MNLITVNVESLRIGRPLPFSIRSEDGRLLAHKGYVVHSRNDLQDMVGRGFHLYVDVSESESHHRAYVNKLHTLVRQDKPLRQIANVQMSSGDMEAPRGEPIVGPRWPDLQEQANNVLRDHQDQTHFLARLERLHTHLCQQTLDNPDGALFALNYLCANESRLYSATQAMLVSVMCDLVARQTLQWPAEQVSTLSKAALTMNIGMIELQDRLVLQTQTPDPTQRALVNAHAQHSANLLQSLGVTNAIWLEAVREHHTPTPGALSTRSLGQQMGRLIQRADLLAAALAPRATRLALSPIAAMHTCYFDEHKAIDEAGALLIKTVGVYSPGSFVRLVNGETGVVVRRGINAATPKVAVLLNQEGMPSLVNSTRDSSQQAYRIDASVSAHEIKIKLNLERLLPLTRPTAADRPW